MIKRNYILILFVIFIFTSCKKELNSGYKFIEDSNIPYRFQIPNGWNIVKYKDNSDFLRYLAFPNDTSCFLTVYALNKSDIEIKEFITVDKKFDYLGTEINVERYYPNIFEFFTSSRRTKDYSKNDKGYYAKSWFFAEIEYGCIIILQSKDNDFTKYTDIYQSYERFITKSKIFSVWWFLIIIACIYSIIGLWWKTSKKNSILLIVFLVYGLHLFLMLQFDVKSLIIIINSVLTLVGLIIGKLGFFVFFSD